MPLRRHAGEDDQAARAPVLQGMDFYALAQGGVAKERAYHIPSQVTATWAQGIILDIIIMKLLLMGSNASAPNQGGARRKGRNGPQLRFQSGHLQEEPRVSRGPLQRDPS